MEIGPCVVLDPVGRERGFEAGILSLVLARGFRFSVENRARF